MGGAASPNIAPTPTPVSAPVESPPSTNETFTECKLQVIFFSVYLFYLEYFATYNCKGIDISLNFLNQL